VTTSIYAQVFDQHNKHWSNQALHNKLFLQTQQSYLNDVLRARGHVFLNDVYDALGFNRTTAGQMVGWLKDGDDGYIDFAITEDEDEPGVFTLDFNVDGVIYEKI
jgi:hypothetical protein